MTDNTCSFSCSAARTDAPVIKKQATNKPANAEFFWTDMQTSILIFLLPGFPDIWHYWLHWSRVGAELSDDPGQLRTNLATIPIGCDGLYLCLEYPRPVRES